MRKQFYNREFNEFLQTETEKHKIFPSNKVWQNIQQELHGTQKWPALAVMTVLLISALTLSTVLYNHSSKTTYNPILITQVSAANNKNNSTATNTSNYITKQEYKIDNKQIIASISNNSSTLVTKNNETNYKPQTVSIYENLNNRILTEEIIEPKQKHHTLAFLQINQSFAKNENSSLLQKSNTILTVTKDDITSTEQDLKEKTDKPKTDDFIADLGYQAPITIKTNLKKSKLEYQFYITPSISYRKLVDDKTRDIMNTSPTANGPFAPQYNLTVNDVVHHKPALGIEVGSGIKYNISKKLSVNTGLQFNIRQYYMDSYYGGYAAAAIAVVRNNRVDTISEFTSLNASSGFAETQLNNRLLQISTPIGLQWNIVNYKKFGLNIAASIQPTLTLNKNVYLISTDYKYYANGTRFFRTWNVNSAAELNISYKVKKYNWFLGYQLRYQHLPTYNEIYPIKEYRLDYGLKLGFNKRLY